MTAYYKDYSTLGNRARQVWRAGSRLRLKETQSTAHSDN